MSKLYTEEQVTNLTKSAYLAGQNHNPFIFQIELNKLTPIELPTDEDIENNAYNDRRVDDWEHEQQIGFERGAKWMRDKIQGGNNE